MIQEARIDQVSESCAPTSSMNRITGTLTLPAAQKLHRGELESVATATLPHADRGREELINAALRQAQEINVEEDQHSGRAESKGREHIRRMLLVRESYEIDGVFDESAFNDEVLRRCGKPRSKINNPHQRLAKMCSAEGTKRYILSKRGYVLAALIKRSIRSDQVLTEFEKCEAIGSGPEQTGMERFIALYKEDVAAGKGTSKMPNPFETWSRKRLAKSARPFLEALDLHSLLATNADIEKILVDEALIDAA